MKYFIIILLFSSFLSCQNNKQIEKEIVDTQSLEEKVLDVQKSSAQNESVVIDSTYLIRSYDNLPFGWTKLRYQPNIDALDGRSVSLGTQLYITEVLGDWLKVWIRIDKDEEGNYYKDPVFGTLYIEKELTGDFKELLVKENELYDIVRDFERKDIASSDTLQIKFITRNEYLDKRNKVVSVVTYDTLDFKKQDGKLILPCDEKTVTLSDVDTDTDNRCFYTYIGQIPFLNSYFISGAYYEEGNYFLIDKKTGEMSASFSECPIFSPNKQFVVDIWGNLYDNCSEFVLSKLDEGNKPQVLLTYYFTRWLPFNSAFGKEIDYFWVADDEIYVKIQTAWLAAQVYEEYAAQYISIRMNFLNDLKQG